MLRKTFDRLQMSNGFPWCIASVPIPSWAATVFPELPEDRAMEKLWDAILRSVRIQGDGTAVSAWRQHLDTLGRRKDLLNKYHFKYLHYTNSLGTDLTIQLPEDHLWAAGNSVMKNGVEFVANMPTEEIFTAPLKTGINGVVYSAMPLVDSGNIIDRFRLGYVVDMLRFQFWPSYPTFNVADVCIVSGAILGAIYYVLLYEKHDRRKTDGASDLSLIHI